MEIASEFRVTIVSSHWSLLNPLAKAIFVPFCLAASDLGQYPPGHLQQAEVQMMCDISSINIYPEGFQVQEYLGPLKM
jgi:hypothetical protein